MKYLKNKDKETRITIAIIVCIFLLMVSVFFLAAFYPPKERELMMGIMEGYGKFENMIYKLSICFSIVFFIAIFYFLSKLSNFK